jgi:aldehyde:ferredoxin oxidoreductase
MNGYTGKLLRVSLSTGEAAIEDIAADILSKYLGGVGLGAYYLYKELEAGTDPLGEGSKLFLGTSPLSDNRFPGGGSITLCFKSPLTGAWGESRCGGDFGPMLRKAGFDAAIIEGRSSEPVYLTIIDGEAELKAADKLRGRMVNDKQEAIRKELENEKVQTLVIGPAGENQVLYATAMCGHRAAGRAGVGTIMGSKNLLGIAVYGEFRPAVADPDGLKESLQAASGVIRSSDTADGFREHGTAGDIAANDAAGDWPTKNWRSNSWGKGEALYDSFYENSLDRNNPCYRGCPIACGRIASVKDGAYKTPSHEGCEYESLSAFTAFVCNDDMDAAVHSTWLCNEYGVDTISAGACIAFAMECAEFGLLAGYGKDVDLSWGSSGVLAEMVKLISLREGIGDLLADGVRKASERLGEKTKAFAIHCKGLEGPAHDGRSGKALQIAYATASRGMCHIHPLEAMAYDSGKMDWNLMSHGLKDPELVDRWDESGKGKAVKILQDGLIVPDILNVCKFFMYAGITLEHLAAMYSASTGFEMTATDLITTGERVMNLHRLFNLREGLSRSDDALPLRVLEKPEFGIYQNEENCAVADFDAMLDEYYDARDWSRDEGRPSEVKLESLGLTGLAGI